MIIRKAVQSDSAEIAKLLLSAMEDIFYEFICEKNYQKALALLSYFTAMQNNQYSYQNCFVAANENQIVGAINTYDGQNLLALRLPFITYVSQHFNPTFNPETETQSGEIYIDSIAVDQKYRGIGIAASLLQAILNQQNHNQKIGLLVEPGNLGARRLYEKVGFEIIGTKTLAGKELYHMQITIN